jgi:hypothetical protein
VAPWSPSLPKPLPKPILQLHPLVRRSVAVLDDHRRSPDGLQHAAELAAAERRLLLTFPFAPESEIAVALESKVKMLLRAEVGPPSAASQTILLRVVRERLAAAPVRP